MKPLTKKQIKTVTKWLKGWEQLEHTVIPIRFKEEFIKHLNTHRVSKSKAKCEHNWQQCTHEAVWMFSKCTKCGKIK